MPATPAAVLRLDILVVHMAQIFVIYIDIILFDTQAQGLRFSTLFTSNRRGCTVVYTGMSA